MKWVKKAQDYGGKYLLHAQAQNKIELYTTVAAGCEEGGAAPQGWHISPTAL